MITAVLKDGKTVTLAEWQKLYGLPVGSENIGHHFTLMDQKIAQNFREHKYLVINELLMRLVDLAREKDGEAWTVNAFNRTKADQERLQNDPRYAAATNSPHEVNMAMDVGCAKYDAVKNNETGKTSYVFNVQKTKDEVLQKVKLLFEAAAELNIKIRVGYKEYMNLLQPMYFVHVDVCPEFFGPGKPFHDQKHPIQWENEITW